MIAQAGDRLDFAIDKLFTRRGETLSNIIVRLSAAPMRGISNAKLKHSNMVNKMNSAVERIISIEKKRLVGFDSVLSSTNPTRVLERGYSMAVNEDGKPVTSVTGLNQGDQLTVVLKDGKVNTEVK